MDSTGSSERKIYFSGAHVKVDDIVPLFRSRSLHLSPLDPQILTPDHLHLSLQYVLYSNGAFIKVGRLAYLQVMFFSFLPRIKDTDSGFNAEFMMSLSIDIQDGATELRLLKSKHFVRVVTKDGLGLWR